MFNKLENWLRRIVADEVAKIKGDVEAERSKLASFISIHTKSATNSVEAELASLINQFKIEIADSLHNFDEKIVHEASVVIADKNKLLTDLHEKLAAALEASRAITHWRAEPTTLQADQDLQKVK